MAISTLSKLLHMNLSYSTIPFDKDLSPNCFSNNSLTFKAFSGSLSFFNNGKIATSTGAKWYGIFKIVFPISSMSMQTLLSVSCYS